MSADIADVLDSAVERLSRSVWDSRVMPNTADIRILLDAMEGDREILAEGYKALSGKLHHASDCATSRAPAERPGPCDCDFQADTTLAEQVLSLWDGGMVKVADSGNPRGYVTYYRPVEAMSAALTAVRRQP